MAATVAASVVQSRFDYANALLSTSMALRLATFISCMQCAHCTELLVSRCSASSPRLSQQQTLTSSMASGTQVDSVQNRPPNIQESINQSATVPQESSSHVPTIALSPRSQSESLIPLILSSPLISVNVLSVFLLLQFGMNYLPLSESQTHWTLLKKRRLKTHLILTSLTTRNV